ARFGATGGRHQWISRPARGGNAGGRDVPIPIPLGRRLMNHLDEIVAYKRAHRQPAPSDLARRVAEAPEVRPFEATLGTVRTVVIAECKKASPSRGVLAERYDPAVL